MTIQDQAVPPDTGACPFARELRFGVELEGFTDEDDIRVGGYHDPAEFPGRSYDGYTWGVSSDSSLDGGKGRGMEFVSPILQGERGAAALCRFLADRKRHGFTVNRTCGVHVHVGLLRYCEDEDISPRDFAGILQRLVYYVRRHSLALYAIGGARRRAVGNYAGALKTLARDAADAIVRDVDTYGGTLDDVVRSARGRWDTLPGDGKFQAVNLTSLRRHGTVEFRLFAGSADPAAVLSFVQMSLAITGRAIADQAIQARPIEDGRIRQGNGAPLPSWARGGMSAHPDAESALLALKGWVDYYSNRPWGHFAECKGIPSRLEVSRAMWLRASHVRADPDTPYECVDGDGCSEADPPVCHVCECSEWDCSCICCDGCGETRPSDELCGTCDLGRCCCECHGCEDCSVTVSNEEVVYSNDDEALCESCRDQREEDQRAADAAAEGSDNVQA